MPALRPSRAHCNEVVLQARSISRTVWKILDSTSFPGRIAAVYNRACTLAFPDGNVISLVLPEIGNGPLNIVVAPGGFPSGDGAPAALAALRPGTAVRLVDHWLEVGGLAVSLDGARTWEPRPDWERLRKHRETITGHLAYLEAHALRLAHEGSLLVLVQADLGWSQQTSAMSRPADSCHLTPGQATIDESFHSVAYEAALSLRAGWGGALALLQAGGQQLAGLGAGLTPAGDDFLSGVMLWTWLAHRSPQSCCEAITGVAASRTTAFSAALLRTAAAGHCSAAWHRLLAVLESGEVQTLADAVERVLSHGHTSGADTLAGFLWMALDQPKSLTV